MRDVAVQNAHGRRDISDFRSGIGPTPVGEILYRNTLGRRRIWQLAIHAVLFDRDGTLITDVPYNGDAAKVLPRAGAVPTVAALRRSGLKTGVVTNQSGIARGLISLGDVESVNRRIDDLFGQFDVWCVCPHAPSDGCGCRKPAPGLVVEASMQLGVRPQQILLVGDRRTDLRAATAAGAVAVLLPSDRTEPNAAPAADLVVSGLDALASLIDSLQGGRA